MFFAFSVPCFCLVAKSCPTVCDHMDCSTPGFPVLHYLPESAQIQVHWVNDAIQPSISSSDALFSSCPQSFPALRSFPISRLSVLGGQSTGASASASVLPKDIQGWFPLGLTGLIFLLSKGLSKFKSINSSVLSFLYGPPLTSIGDYWKNYSFDYRDLCLQSDVSAFKYAV